jgi:WD40 repeat protein
VFACIRLIPLQGIIMRVFARTPRACYLLLALTTGVAARADGPDLGAKAQAVLKAHCSGCHGQPGTAKGGFYYVLDRDLLVARKKVVPGKAEESELYKRVAKGVMPPKTWKKRPSADDVAVLKQWIDAGAAPMPPVAGPRPFIAEAAVARAILTDLETIPPRQRRFARYFTLTNLYNAGLADDELATARQALAKLMNSLSWHPHLAKIRVLDPAKTLVRIDLRDFKWNARSWERLVAVYPYRIARSSGDLSGLTRKLVTATGTELPCLRADWFIATASRPPLYHDLLQLPTTDRSLERLLQVDVPANIEEETVLRAGFNGSGVAKNNRLIERHDASYGAYWRSYDFSDNSGRQNLFEHPLGPRTGQNSFEHAGGEIIFNLPNGLQGYLLVDRNGRRIDKAPVDIVSDPKRPDRRVETGLSCMSCHVRGLIHKADQVRAHVDKNASAFSKEDAEIIKALYPPEAVFRQRLERDAARFLKALKKLDVSTDDPEPVMATTLRYETPLDLAAAAAEAGLPGPEFAKRLRAVPGLTRTLGPLQARGGTVQRQVFLDAFPELVRELRIGETPAAEDGPTATTPFGGHDSPVLSLAISRDNKLALSGCEDGLIRLWAMPGGKQLRRFEGHKGAVHGLAFSADGRQFLSCGQDRTVRRWDVATGKELGRFTGHTDVVRCVAFAPDGRRVLSGGSDQTLRLWDVATGKELHALAPKAGTIHAVAFSPDGRLALSACADKVVYLWDVDTGKELRRFEGHTRPVHSVAFSPDGKQAISGGQDKTVRLWDVSSGKQQRVLEGHANAVVRVAFSADGKWVLSGSSQHQEPDKTIRVWNAESGRQLHGAGSKGTVWTHAFSADGRSALSGGTNSELRFWHLSK